jgi:hypothetical protein
LYAADNGEFGESPRLGINLYPAVVLFDNDVMAHRKTKPRAFSRRFGREEGVEYLFLHFGRDAGTVVAYAYLYVVTEIFGSSIEYRLEIRVTNRLRFVSTSIVPPCSFNNNVAVHRKAMLRASPYLFRGFASTPVDEAIAKLE